MCRLTAYIGPPILAADLVTRPNRSIITQSFSARERITARGYLNGDGFGLGWYPSLASTTSAGRAAIGEPCVFTSTGPAWNNENLARLAKSITSPIVFAHVRAATSGLNVCECCCHPFHFLNYMFMHNGMIGGFKSVRRRLLKDLNDVAFSFAISKGESDSALCFALFINELKDLHTVYPPDQLRQFIDNVIAKISAAVKEENITETSMLNFVVSDGISLLATRYVFSLSGAVDVAASLYFASGTRFECKDVSTEGEYRMVHADRRDNLAIITSEPLTNDATDWVSVPVNHAVIVTDDMHVLLTPIGVLSPAVTACITSLTRHYLDPIAFTSKPPNMIVSALGSPGGECMEAEHRLSGHSDTVLSLVAFQNYLFSGSQDGTIRVWDPREYKCIDVLRGHQGSVLALIVTKGYLFSASSDNTIRKWSMVPPFPCVGELCSAMSGDILSLAAHGDYIYAGFQDTCIRRVAVSLFPSGSHRLVRPPSIPSQELCAGCCTYSSNRCIGPEKLEVFAGHLSSTADRTKDSHFGYVYALIICGEHLVSGAGDGSVLVWSMDDKVCKASLKGHTGSVLALASDSAGTTIFSGSRDSSIRAWDLDGLCCKRTLSGHSGDVLSLVVAGSMLFSGGADGLILAWSCESLGMLFSLSSGPDTVQALSLSPTYNLLFSGSSTNAILAWRTVACSSSSSVSSPLHRLTPFDAGLDLEDPEPDVAPTLVDSLRVFVSFASVSGSENHRAHCWKAAKYLAYQMRLLRCTDVRLIPCGDDRNPIVFGRMSPHGSVAAENSNSTGSGNGSGNGTTASTDQSPPVGGGKGLPTVVVYGHYDVQPATEAEWVSSPWQIRALDGYLYGRGVTDNKGPMLAFLHAAHELLEENLLRCNLVFLFEGEEEAQSDGFREAINAMKKLPKEESGLSDVAMILVSNNYWIDEERPCLTYGTRGVLNLKISVRGPSHDIHSGVHGGAVVEPLFDLLGILASLADSKGQVLVPGFYDDVVPVTPEEEHLFDQINLNLPDYCSELGVRGVAFNRSRDVLISRWVSPSLSVVAVNTSNSSFSFSKIPGSATAKISVRFVARQTVERLTSLISGHLETEFAKRRSPNILSVSVAHSADWWLGDPKSPIYSAASDAIEHVWGQAPVMVREGGTMPITSFLSTALEAPALLLPMGQSSDNAHLANERIRVSNLLRGKDVIKRLLLNMFAPSTVTSPERAKTS